MDQFGVLSVSREPFFIPSLCVNLIKLDVYDVYTLQ